MAPRNPNPTPAQLRAREAARVRKQRQRAAGNVRQVIQSIAVPRTIANRAEIRRLQAAYDAAVTSRRNSAIEEAGRALLNRSGEIMNQLRAAAARRRATARAARHQRATNTVFERISFWFQDNAANILSDLSRRTAVTLVHLVQTNVVTGRVSKTSRPANAYFLNQLSSEIEMFSEIMQPVERKDPTNQKANVIENAEDFYFMASQSADEDGENSIRILTSFTTERVTADKTVADVTNGSDAFEGDANNRFADVFEKVAAMRRWVQGSFCQFVLLANTPQAQNEAVRYKLATYFGIFVEPIESKTASARAGFDMKAEQFFESMTNTDLLEHFNEIYSIDLATGFEGLLSIADQYTPDWTPRHRGEKSLMKFSLIANGREQDVERLCGKAIKREHLTMSIKGSISRVLAARYFRDELRGEPLSRTSCFLSTFIELVQQVGLEDDVDVKSFLCDYVLQTRSHQKSTKLTEVAVLLKRNGLFVNLVSDDGGRLRRKCYGEPTGRLVGELACEDNHFFVFVDKLMLKDGEALNSIQIYKTFADEKNGLTRRYTGEEMLALKFNGEKDFIKAAGVDVKAEVNRIYFPNADIERETVQLFDSGAEPKANKAVFKDIIAYDTETFNKTDEADKNIAMTKPYCVAWTSMKADVVSTDEQNVHLAGVMETRKSHNLVKDVSIDAIMKSAGQVSPFAVKADDGVHWSKETLDHRRRFFATKGGEDERMPFLAWCVNRYGEHVSKGKAWILIGCHNSTFDLNSLVSQAGVKVMSACEHKGKNVTTTLQVLYGGKRLFVKVVDTYRLMPGALSTLYTGLKGVTKEQCIYELYNELTVPRLQSMPHAEFDEYLERRVADAAFFKGVNDSRAKFDRAAFVGFCDKWGAFSGGNDGVVDALKPALVYCVQDCLVLAAAWLTQSIAYKRLFPLATKTLFESLSIPSYANQLSVDYGCIDGVVNVGGLTRRLFQAGIVGGRVCANAMLCPRFEDKTQAPFEVVCKDGALSKNAIVDFDANSLYLSIQNRINVFPVGVPKHLHTVASFPMSLSAFIALSKTVKMDAYQIELVFPSRPITDDDRKQRQFPSVSLLRHRAETKNKAGKVVKAAGSVCEDQFNAPGDSWRDWCNEGWESTRHSVSEIKLDNWLRIHQFSDQFCDDIIVNGGVFFNQGFNSKIKSFTELIKAGRAEQKALKKAAENAGDEDAENAAENAQLTQKLVGNSCYGKHAQKQSDSRQVVADGDEALLQFILRNPDEQTSYSTYACNEEGRRTYVITTSAPCVAKNERELKSSSNRAHVGCRILDGAHFVVGAVMACIQDIGETAYITDTDSIHTTRGALVKLPAKMTESFPDLWPTADLCVNDNEFLGFHSDFTMPKLHSSVPKKPKPSRARETVSTRLISLGKKSYCDKLSVIEFERDDPFNVKTSRVLQLENGEFDYHVRQLGVPMPSINLKAREEHAGSVIGIYESLADGGIEKFDPMAAGRTSFIRFTPGVKRFSDEADRPGWVMALQRNAEVQTKTIQYAPKGHKHATFKI